MKKTTILSILLFLFIGIHAQDDYRPFVVEGKCWNYVIHITSCEDRGNQEIGNDFVYTEEPDEYGSCIIKNDTLIEGVTYKKVMFERENWKSLFACIREEDKKVYVRHYWAGDPRDLLLYDFSLKVGDLFMDEYDFYPDKQLRVLSIEEKQGKRVFSLSEEDSDVPIIKWVEGVGGAFGLGLNAFWDISTCSCGCVQEWPVYQSCTLGDEVLCRFDDDGNVVLGVEEVRTDVDKDRSIYDLQGRRLSAEPERGLYIKDGKKIAR